MKEHAFLLTLQEKKQVLFKHFVGNDNEKFTN